MDALVDIVVEDARWQALGLEALGAAAAMAVWAEVGLAAEGFGLCLMGCDDARIMALNADFRGKAAPTNVLSWPSEERGAEFGGEVPDLPEAGTAEEPAHLGDIAIAYDTCAAEALAADKPLAEHVTHLIVHGLLHLLGYDHEDDADAELMEATEVRILARLGLSDPY